MPGSAGYGGLTTASRRHDYSAGKGVRPLPVAKTLKQHTIMKKIYVSIAAMILAAGMAHAASYAPNDTTALKNAELVFRVENYTTSKGQEKTRYITTYNGKEFISNKTSMQRYADIRRWGGVPCVVKITTPSGSERIAVL